MAVNQIKQTYENYPTEMRTQLWPLCCGARIISGFRNAYRMNKDELIKQINDIIDHQIPDHQVYSGEKMMPKLIFLTLNNDQMASQTIMEAIKTVGFKQFAVGRPRGHAQGFFVLDKTQGTFKITA